MKIKTTLLAGAAALLATSAFAADLPSRKSAPVEYVKVCDVYGAGFFYIPGTDTCLKVGGRVRVELMTQRADNVWRHRSLARTFGAGDAINGYVSKNGIDSIGWHARGRLDMDARTQTAWGTVQTVILMRFRSRSGTYAGNYVNGVYAAANGFDPTLERAYIRFAGFTFGRGSSNFTTMPSFMYNTEYRGGFASGVTQLAYTATFGSGFSATLALEDRNDFGQGGRTNALNVTAGTNGALGDNELRAVTGPSRLPVITANLRVDQSWGMLQLSGSVIRNNANITGQGAAANPLLVINGNGPIINKTGWAVALGGRINLPMLARGDRFDWTVGYTDGHLDMIFGQGPNGRGSSNGIYMGGLQRADRNMTVYDCVPGAGVIGVCAESAKAFNVAGIFTHYWSPTLRSHLAASYLRLTPGNVTRNTDWLDGGLTRASAYAVAHNLVWSPVRRFDVGFEIAYAHLSQGAAGLLGGLPQVVPVAAACPGGLAGCAPAAANFKLSPHQWNARIRVQRDF